MTLNDLVPASADGAKSRAQRYFEAVPQHQAAVLDFLETLPETTPTEFADFGGHVDTSDLASQRPPQSALEQFLFHGN